MSNTCHAYCVKRKQKIKAYLTQKEKAKLNPTIFSIKLPTATLPLLDLFGFCLSVAVVKGNVLLVIDLAVNEVFEQTDQLACKKKCLSNI